MIDMRPAMMAKFRTLLRTNFLIWSLIKKPSVCNVKHQNDYKIGW